MILNAMKRGRMAKCAECKDLLDKEDVKVWHQANDDDKDTGRIICKPCAIDFGWEPTEAPERKKAEKSKGSALADLQFDNLFISR